jgi:hypothetical protein
MFSRHLFSVYNCEVILSCAFDSEHTSNSSYHRKTSTIKHIVHKICRHYQDKDGADLVHLIRLLGVTLFGPYETRFPATSALFCTRPVNKTLYTGGTGLNFP